MDKQALALSLFKMKKRIEKVQNEYDIKADLLKDMMVPDEEVKCRAGRIKFMYVDSLSVAPERLYMKLTHANFIQCVKVNIGKAKKFLGEDILKKIGSRSSYDKLLLMPVKKKGKKI